MNTDPPQDAAKPESANTPSDAQLSATTDDAQTPSPAQSEDNSNTDSNSASGDAVHNPQGSTLEQLREQALEATKNVFDPEIPVNIFELGLIYDVAVDEERNAKVTMTLTSPACPAAQELPMEVQGRIAVIHGINNVEVDVVFDPPWTPDKMSEAAKVQLGFDL